MFNDLHEYIPSDWRYYFDKDMLHKIVDNLNKYPVSDVLPRKHDIFKAFSYIKPIDVRVVIIGELIPCREYANAIAYGMNGCNNESLIPFNDINRSCRNKLAQPPCLRSILTELKREYNTCDTSTFNDTLIDWCKQGVLLINNPLTCVVKRKNAHSHIGWNDIVIKLIDRLTYRQNKPLVLFAWNYTAYNVFTTVVNDWFPSMDFTYYTSPSFPDVYMIVTGDICDVSSKHGGRVKTGKISINKRDKYVKISKRNPFIGSNCFTISNHILRTYNIDNNDRSTVLTIKWI